MEELYQDPETVVQQLRLLLAAKEEELNKLRGETSSSDEGDKDASVAGRLIEELEEKKLEAEELRGRMKDLKAKANEKLSAMAKSLEEKEKIITALQESRADGAPAGNLPSEEEIEKRIKELEESLAAESEKMKSSLAELTGQLAEKDALIAAMREEIEGAASRDARGEDSHKADADAAHEILRMRDELNQAKMMINELESAAIDEERAQAEVEKLYEEMESLKQEAESHIAELQHQIVGLEKERDDALSAATRPPASDQDALLEDLRVEIESTHESVLKEKDGELSAVRAQLSSERERIRGIEEERDHCERSYRTAQARLHRLGITQQVLWTACVGLSVFLLIVFGMKSRHARTVPLRESDAPAETILLAETSVTAPAQDEKAEEKSETRDTEAESSRSLDDEIFMLAGREGHADGGAEAKEEVPRIAYEVKRGDSLWLICQRELGDAGVMEKVARDNKLNNPSSLKVGDIIYLSRR